MISMRDVAQRKSGIGAADAVAGSIPVVTPFARQFDEEILALIRPAEGVSVTSMVERFLRQGRPWPGRRQMRVRLMRLVDAGLLRCRPRDTVSGRGGRVIFSRTS